MDKNTGRHCTGKLASYFSQTIKRSVKYIFCKEKNVIFETYFCRKKYFDMKFRIFNLHNFRQIKQLSHLTEQQKFDIEVVGSVLPFRTNSYVVNELIDWQNFENDPIYNLNFPNRKLLKVNHFDKISETLFLKKDTTEISRIANQIRAELNPHPAHQLFNIPSIDETKLVGIQHKYRETILFFPSQGQTCHAYCTFCFRWPQFTGVDHVRFAMKQGDLLVNYLKQHPLITDVLFTGGDPMIMNIRHLKHYLELLLESNAPNLTTIRIGTKVLSYWPYRFLTDPDSQEILRLFEKVNKSNKNLAFMAHFNHPVELQTNAVQQAIRAIRNTGTNIRVQSPVLNHINADAQIWTELMQRTVHLGMIPYYYFIVRNTGAQEFFAIPLVKAIEIYRDMYSNLSGIARTVRGPIMSTDPGKVQLLGVSEIAEQKVFVLTFVQGRNARWNREIFYAKYDESAIWFDQLKPAFGDKFFYEDEFNEFLNRHQNDNDFTSHFIEIPCSF